MRHKPPVPSPDAWRAPQCAILRRQMPADWAMVPLVPIGRQRARPIPSVLFALALLVSRALLLLALRRLTRGQETSSDSDMLIALAEKPFALLLGYTSKHGQHPPLLGVLEACFYIPLRSVFEPYVALRATYIIYEAIAGFFFADLLWLVELWKAQRRWALICALVLPIGWVTPP